MKNFAILAAILGAFVFTTSCKKIVEPTALDVIANAGTATISGIAYANLDDQDAEAEFAPSGTKITVAIDPSDFPGASTYYTNPNMLIYTATVGTNGAWTVTVKAPKTPISAMISVDPFRATYTDALGNDTDDLIWSSGAQYASVWEGNTSLVDFWYNF
jgi:hypothetical protein